jgi:hypothetical protein
MESISINPSERKEIIIESKIDLNKELLKYWIDEVKQAIAERCTTDTYRGKYNGENLKIEVTSQMPYPGRYTDDRKLKKMRSNSKIKIYDRLVLSKNQQALIVIQ